MKLNMSDWCPFRKRDKELKGKLDNPGVYFIAKDVRRNRQPSIQCRNIIYIGRTTGRTTNLRKRLNAFEKSCEFYYGSHSGGQTFHESEINRRFQEKIKKLRKAHGNRAKAEYIKHIKRRPKFEKRWKEWRDRLWVAVWTPSDGGTGKFKRLPDEHQPTYVEMTLQAEFLIGHKHKRLPKHNKRIG